MEDLDGGHVDLGLCRDITKFCSPKVTSSRLYFGVTQINTLASPLASMLITLHFYEHVSLPEVCVCVCVGGGGCQCTTFMLAN